VSTVPITVETTSKLNALARIAYDWPSEALYRDAEAVEELLSHRGWDAVQRLMGDRADQVQKEIFRTISVNQSAAAQQAGWLEGIQASQKAALAIREAAERKRADLEKDAAEAAKGAS
jgi:hypothetical protein